MLWYPFVGALIAVILISIIMLSSSQDPMLVAAVILAIWVMITGGLHLDGLADSADAWVGSHGDKQRALEIMKDPQAGPVAVIMLVLILIIKFAALHSLIKQPDDGIWLLMLSPVLARCVPMLLFLTTPYVREQGLGSAMAKYLPQKSAWAVLLLTALVVITLSGIIKGIILLSAVLLLVWFLRYLMLKNIDGMTGDTIGASIEIIEVVALLVLVVL